MAFTTEERRLLADSVERYIADEYNYDVFRKIGASPEGFSRAAWRSYAELGWLGIALAEDYGGMGGSMADLAMIMEYIGRGLLREPYLSTVVLGAGLIEQAGSSDQKADLLPQIADGSLILAFAHSEQPGGFTRNWVKTLAKRNSDGFVLMGKKSFVLQGPTADKLIVSARIGSADGTIGLFLVDKAAEGMEIIASRGVDGRPVAAFAFHETVVPASAHLAGADAESAIETVLDRATLAVCAESVGAMAVANAQTLDYIKTRKQFGKTIGSFQSLQHRMVDMTVLHAEARALVAAAVEAVDSSEPNASYMIAAAKVKAARASRFVGEQSIQLHGGMGMTDELAIGHYYKRLMALEALFGDADWQLDRLGAMYGERSPT